MANEKGVILVVDHFRKIALVANDLKPRAFAEIK
jgi:hypothetical protein